MTKRYNLSKIMTRAWELVKTTAMNISNALRKAWKEAKTMMKGTEKQIKWAEDIKASAYKTCEFANIEIDRIVARGVELTKAEKMTGYTKVAIETMKKQLDELFRNIDDAAVIIDKRNRLSEQRIREFIKGLSRR